MTAPTTPTPAPEKKCTMVASHASMATAFFRGAARLVHAATHRATSTCALAPPCRELPLPARVAVEVIDQIKQDVAWLRLAQVQQRAQQLGDVDQVGHVHSGRRCGVQPIIDPGAELAGVERRAGATRDGSD